MCECTAIMASKFPFRKKTKLVFIYTWKDFCCAFTDESHVKSNWMHFCICYLRRDESLLRCMLRVSSPLIPRTVHVLLFVVTASD